MTLKPVIQRSRVFTGVFAVLCLAVAWRICAQHGAGFRVEQGYPPPHQDRLKLLTTAEEYQVQGNGRYLASRFKVQMFRETGATNAQLIIEAPECLLNPDGRSANSAGPLVINSSDGQLHLEGEGFSWLSSSNSTLTISNKVSTTLKLESLSRPGPAGTNVVRLSTATGKNSESNQIVRIFSDHFFFDRNANLYTYTGNVRVEDSEMDLTCAKLSIHLFEGGIIDSIVADSDVVMVSKPDGGRVTGDHAVYNARNGRKWVELTGNPRWQNGPSEATGAVFVFDQVNRTLRIEGQAWFKTPRPSSGASGLLFSPAAPRTAVASLLAPEFVEGYADSMTFQFPPTSGPVESVLAERNVIILDQAQHSRATSDRAFLSSVTRRMELTGNAIWQADQRLARGGLLIFADDQKSFSARTNAYLKFPVTALGGALPATAADSPNARNATNQFIEALADSYDYQSNVLTLRDQVHAAFVQDGAIVGTLDTRLLTATFNSVRTNQLQLESLVADQDVYARQLPWQDRHGDRFERELKADRLTARFWTNGLVQEIVAEQHVSSRQTKTPAGTNQPIVLTLRSDSLTAHFLPTTNSVEFIVADHNVVLTRNEMTTTEDKAVYTSSNGIVRLVGNVKASQPGQFDFSGPELSVDMTTGVRIFGHQGFRMRIPITGSEVRDLQKTAKPKP